MTTTRKTLITLGALLVVGVLTVTAGLSAGSDGRTTDSDRPTATTAADGTAVDVGSEPTTTGGTDGPSANGPAGADGRGDGSVGDAPGQPGAAPGGQDADAAPGAPAPPCLSARCLGLEPQNPIPRVTVDLVGPTYQSAHLVRCTPRRVVDYWDFIVELEITGVSDPSGIRSVGVRDNLTMDSVGGGTYRRAWSEHQRGGATTIVITDNAGNRTTVPVQWPEASCPAPPA